MKLFSSFVLTLFSLEVCFGERVVDKEIRTGLLGRGKYTGDLVNGKPHTDKTDGKFVSNRRGQTYVGGWKNGYFDGMGTLKMYNGETYTGQFEKGRMNGKGKYTYYDGRIYVGDVKKNQWHGTGMMIWPNGKKYVGSFSKDRRHGEGLMIRGSTAVKAKWSRNVQGEILEEDSDFYDHYKEEDFLPSSSASTVFKKCFKRVPTDDNKPELETLKLGSKSPETVICQDISDDLFVGHLDDSGHRHKFGIELIRGKQRVKAGSWFPGFAKNNGIEVHIEAGILTTRFEFEGKDYGIKISNNYTEFTCQLTQAGMYSKKDCRSIIQRNENLSNDTSKYDGGIKIKDGKKLYHGYGEYKSNEYKKIKKYTGFWTDDQMSPFGIVTYSDNNVFVGFLSNGKRHGVGLMINRGNQVKSGDGITITKWTENKANHVAMMHVYPDEKSRYLGFCKSGKHWGEGVYIDNKFRLRGAFKTPKEDE